MEQTMVTMADDALDRTFAALAHPTRRAILSRLARDGEASVSDLAEPFDVSLMAVSKHLKVMTEAGLVRREKDGRVQRCSYDPTHLDAARAWIELHRRYWEQQLDALAAYLERPSDEDTPSGERRESTGGTP
jgi:DNA-binding transcriptional ArsR family regulator